MKVSVCITAYNHAKYIAQAVEGVLMQVTDFDFEIIIGEDDSKDGTREIVKKYKEKYPDRIKLFLNDRRNVIYINGKPTGRWNFVNNIKSARGDYIALLDGDDYWTSPEKLQKQADFLDSHNEFAMCFHNVEMFMEGTDRRKILSPRRKKKVYTLKDLLVENFISSCSVMFRRGLFGEFPNWFYSVPVADWPLYLLTAQYGDVGYIDEVLGAYRVHAGGIWSKEGELRQLQNIIGIYEPVNTHFNYRYNNLIKAVVALRRCRMIEKKLEMYMREHGLTPLAAALRKIFDPYAIPE